MVNYIVFLAKIYFKYMLNICCKQLHSLKYLFEINNIYLVNITVAYKLNVLMTTNEVFPSDVTYVNVFSLIEIYGGQKNFLNTFKTFIYILKIY